VDLQVVVDPEIMGGVIARVGDEVIDGTVRRRLELALEQLAG
jgi:F-type H+-transporting ATPase subunit delta